jgi:methionyl-tRNA formyltransferase
MEQNILNNIVICGIMPQCQYIVNFLNANKIKVNTIVTISAETAKKNNCYDQWVDHTEFAESLGIELHCLDRYSMKSEADLNWFKEKRFSVMILGGWQRLIPENVLKTLSFGGIGQHGSPYMLPMGRGRSPINWAILEGDKTLYWQLFLMTPGMDDGDILDFVEFDITEFDTCNTIYDKVTIAVSRMYLRTLKSIDDGTINPRPQIGEPTWYRKRTPEDGEIDWNKPVREVYNLIRAVTKPYPGARTVVGDRKLIIWDAFIWDTKLGSLYENTKTGQVVETINGYHLIRCKDGLLAVTQSEWVE